MIPSSYGTHPPLQAHPPPPPKGTNVLLLKNCSFHSWVQTAMDSEGINQ